MTMRDTANFPTVSVPVLSNTRVVIFLASSKADLFFISSPFFADKAVDLATTSGTANPRACGQQITMTVTIRSIENARSFPDSHHTRKVAIPATMAISVSQRAAVSASNCVLDFDL